VFGRERHGGNSIITDYCPLQDADFAEKRTELKKEQSRQKSWLIFWFHRRNQSYGPTGHIGYIHLEICIAPP
jgi:hypothetical protein